MAELVWKMPPMGNTLVFADGSSKFFRLVPGMARAGFLLSPFVKSTQDFLHLRNMPGAPHPVLPKPKYIVVGVADRDQRWAWRSQYHLSISPIAFPPLQARWSSQDGTAPLRAPFPASPRATACFIDDTDGSPVGNAPIAANWAMRITGWALMGLPGDASPDHIEVGFRDPQGAFFTAPTLPITRTDVAASYHVSNPDHIGFTAEPDIKALPPGTYSVWILPRRGATAQACATALMIIKQ